MISGCLRCAERPEIVGAAASRCPEWTPFFWRKTSCLALRPAYNESRSTCMLHPTMLLVFALTSALGGSLASLDGSVGHGDQATVDLGRSFRLRPGESGEVSGTSMRLRFERVSEDSRCPVGVTCVWAGDAIVQLTTTVNQSTSRVELHTNPDLEQDHHVRDGFGIRLVRLEPLPTTNAPVGQADYLVTLMVERSS